MVARPRLAHWIWNGAVMKPTLSALTRARVQGLLRLALLLLCGGVAATRSDLTQELLWAAAVSAAGALTTYAEPGARWAVAATSVEGLVSGSAVVATGSGHSAFLPYLIAPAFSGGLAAGL